MKNINIENTISKNIAGNPDWFKNWFNSSFYHKLYANRDEKEAARFIDELLNELAPSAQSHMLDLGCGNGRHSKYLAAKGFNVTGLDLASSSIREAKKAESLSLRFYRHDMRTPFGENCFDHVFNFFTSFGYFKTNEDDHKVIANISASLKPGGTLVMDYINSPYAEKKLMPEEKKEIDGIVYNISRWTDEKYFFKKIVIEDVLFGELPEFVEQVKKFSLADLDLLFTKHCLEIQHVYGDYQLNEYNKETSPRLILIAKKISDEKINN